MVATRNIAVLLWALPYFVCGYFSLWLHEPASRAAFVWLPAGVALGALILLRWRNWPLAVAGLFAAQVVLGLIWRDDALTSVVLAATSCAAAMAGAWSTRRLTVAREGLQYAAALVAGAFVCATVSTMLGGGWLIVNEGVAPMPMLSVWFVANLGGALIVAPMLNSWSHVALRRSGDGTRRDLRLGLACYVLLVVGTLSVFDTGSWSGLSGVERMEMTYLPIMLAILVTLVWGPRGGSFAVLTLALIALYQSAQGEGPFIQADGEAGDALLETQVYLVLTALMVLLVNTLRGSREQALEDMGLWRDRFELALAGSGQLMYRYDIAQDRFELGGDLDGAFGPGFQAPGTLEQMAALVHPEDRPAVSMRWALRNAGEVGGGAMRFRVGTEGAWRAVVDQGKPIVEPDGSHAIVAGMWRLADEA